MGGGLSAKVAAQEEFLPRCHRRQIRRTVLVIRPAAIVQDT
jgi:hypothetical protein